MLVKSSYQFHCAFGLIEMLIVCAISSFLLLMLGKTIVIQHRTYAWQQALAVLQENARFSSILLNQYIEKAGYVGCGRLEYLTKWLDHTTSVLSADRVIRGYHAVSQHWQPSLPDELRHRVAEGSDVIEVNYALPVGEVTQDVQQTTQVNIKTTQSIHTYDHLLFSNCQQAEIVKIIDLTHSENNLLNVALAEPMQSNYLQHTFVGKVVHLFFYIADTKRVNKNGDPIYGLFMYDQYRQHIELIAGVDEMHIGYRTQYEQANYQTAISIDEDHQWQDVIAVKLALNVNSIDPFLSKNGELLNKPWEINVILHSRIDLCSAGLCYSQH